MQSKELDAREKIMEATMGLIVELGDVSRITIRDITARAGVGVGLINYHFQSKDNLINQCVQRMIGKVISKFDELYKSLDMKPLDKLRYLIKSTATFLVSQPGISRISILTDFHSGNTNDNSVQTTKAYFPVVKEVCGDKKTDKEVSVLLHVLISSIQVAFLRNSVIKETLNMDFNDANQSEELIDMIIDSLFSDFIS